ncbi:MAG: substrate-binding domain-containing protein [Cetobacterium sp.]
MRKLFTLLGAMAITFSAFAGEILMGTTTSLDNTGFLKVVKEKLKEEKGIDLNWIARGTGEALALGKRGDVDVLFVHDKKREQQFIADGYGTKRHELMYNYFVLVTTEDNDISTFPKDLNSAMTKIAKENLIFISRGDNSGTHSKEKSVWKAVNITPNFSNYKSAGTGMGKTLNMTSELGGYTISDYGTFETLKNKFGLKNIPLSGKESLKNTYSIVELSNVDPSKKADIQTFIEFMNSPEMLTIIDNYGKNTIGTNLFFRDK